MPPGGGVRPQEGLQAIGRANGYQNGLRVESTRQGRRGAGHSRAGCAPLSIEARIGELLRTDIPDTGTGGAPKQPRLKGEAASMPDRHREAARTIARNPAAVAAVIREAREKTAEPLQPRPGGEGHVREGPAG
jgi:hypothetical protein